MVLLGLSVIAGGITFLTPDTFPYADAAPLMAGIFFGVFILLSLTLFPLMVAAGISFLSVVSWGAKVWTRPSHDCNPFRLGNPLLFVHFVSFMSMAAGLGMLLTSFLGGINQLLQGVYNILVGCALLAAVHVAMRWCKHKMEPVSDTTPKAPADRTA
jgi:hypothetical protein